MHSKAVELGSSIASSRGDPPLSRRIQVVGGRAEIGGEDLCVSRGNSDQNGDLALLERVGCHLGVGWTVFDRGISNLSSATHSSWHRHDVFRQSIHHVLTLRRHEPGQGRGACTSGSISLGSTRDVRCLGGQHRSQRNHHLPTRSGRFENAHESPGLERPILRP